MSETMAKRQIQAGGKGSTTASERLNAGDTRARIHLFIRNRYGTELVHGRVLMNEVFVPLCNGDRQAAMRLLRLCVDVGDLVRGPKRMMRSTSYRLTDDKHRKVKVVRAPKSYTRTLTAKAKPVNSPRPLSFLPALRLTPESVFDILTPKRVRRAVTPKQRSTTVKSRVRPTPRVQPTLTEIVANLGRVKLATYLEAFPSPIGEKLITALRRLM